MMCRLSPDGVVINMQDCVTLHIDFVRLLDNLSRDCTGSQLGLMGGWIVQVNDWMEGMLMDCYEDLYRFKGVLAIQGWPDRFIFQASQPMFGCDLALPRFQSVNITTLRSSFPTNRIGVMG